MGWQVNYAAYLKSLNKWQVDCVQALADTASRQPLRIVAAAGSGKTRVSIAATARILNEGILAPQNMILTTFTRKAAGELKQRLQPLVAPQKLAALLGEGRGNIPRLGTWHSIAGRYMSRMDLAWRKADGRWVARKRHPAAPDHLWDFAANLDAGKRKAGLPSSDSLLRAVCGPSRWSSGKPKEFKYLPGFVPLDLTDGDDPSAPTPRDYGLALGVLRAYGFTPGSVLEHLKGAALVDEFEADGLCRLLDVWMEINKAKQNLRAYDFADVMYAYWKRGKDKAGLVIVDEAQDNDAVQLGLASDIARRGRGKFALVGDIRQAIYSWRGAVPEIMATADVEYRAQTWEIPTNYRSGRLIVALGNRIALNPDTGEPEPWSIGSPSEASRRDPADLIFQVRIGHETYPYSVSPDPWRPGTEQPEGVIRVPPSAQDPMAEAEQVAAEIIQMRAQGIGAGDMAVLVRTNAVGTLFELGLIKQQIPVMRLGASQSFFDRKIVADAMAYTALAYEDDTEDLRRIYNKPERDIYRRGTEDYLGGAGKGQGALAALNELARRNPRSRAGYEDIVDAITKLRERAQRKEGWRSVLEHVTELMAPQGLHDDAADAGGVDTSSDTDRELLDAFLGLAASFGTFQDLRRWADKLRDPKNVRSYSAQEMDQWTPKQWAEFERERKERVVISSIHKCVSPGTLVEGPWGLARIEDIAEEGLIATPWGPRPYRAKVTYEDRAMLRITTRRGYEIEVTDDHGLFTWDAVSGDYVRQEARELTENAFLRLKLGAVCGGGLAVPLPELPAGDVRVVVPDRVPSTLSDACAEFFGLMVADGTVYRAGFRLKKRHRDVVERFSELVLILFGLVAEQSQEPECWDAEVNSTLLSAWLLSVGGMGPRVKAVPQCVLSASVDRQARFLRGLYASGRMNLDGTPDDDGRQRVDYVSYSTANPDMAQTVQTMLLRFKIVASRFPVEGTTDHRVVVYGQDARRFRDAIGFASAFKQCRLIDGTFAPETQQNAIPVHRADPILPKYDCAVRRNARRRGYISRDTARTLGAGSDKLDFYHARIDRIELFRGPAVCVSVPSSGRFLQNGFDGANSKGIEWRFVWVPASDGIFPHRRSYDKPSRFAEEQRLFYVAVTRAADVVTITSADETLSGKPAGPSPFIGDYVIPLLREEGLTDLGVAQADRRAPELVQEPPDQHALVKATLIPPWEIVAWGADGFLLGLPDTGGTDRGDIDYTVGISVDVVPGGFRVSHDVPGLTPEVQEVSTFRDLGETPDVLRVLQTVMQNAIARQDFEGVGEPPGPSGTPYVPPSTSPPPGSSPRTNSEVDVDAEWRSFVAFVRDQPGEARPGMTWVNFASILAQQKSEIMANFALLRVAGNPEEVPEEVPSEVSPPLSWDPEAAEPGMRIRHLPDGPSYEAEIFLDYFSGEPRIVWKMDDAEFTLPSTTISSWIRDEEVEVLQDGKPVVSQPAVSATPEPTSPSTPSRALVWVGIPPYGPQTGAHGRSVPSSLLGEVGISPITGKAQQVRLNLTRRGGGVTAPALLRLGSFVALGEPDNGFSEFSVFRVDPLAEDAEYGGILSLVASGSTVNATTYAAFWARVAQEARARWSGDALSRALDRGGVVDSRLRWKARILYEGSSGRPLRPGASGSVVAVGAVRIDDKMINRALRDVFPGDLAALARAGVLVATSQEKGPVLYSFISDTAPAVETLALPV